MNQERRHVVRQYLRVNAMLHVGHAPAVAVHTIDVGLAGMALNAAHPLAVGATVQLRFDVPVDGKLESVTTDGSISYCVPAAPGFKVGIIFETLDADAKTLIVAYLAT
ncbi:MAG: PilZ domain-containing protein [Herminiimonas sp.]|nr:PilZ domain-containing protein [Herminiimonas sp.]